MKKLLRLICLLFICQMPAVEHQDVGTLIVSYQTDNKGERLDRIRFWLKDQQGRKLALYPKGKAYVDNTHGPSRTVVIEGLPEGHYTLKFLVPNTDNYFQELSERDFLISSSNVVKIDQHIKTLAKNQENTEFTELPQQEEIPSGKLLVLSNIKEGIIRLSPINTPEIAWDFVIENEETLVELPEGTYRLYFDTDAPNRLPPRPIDVAIDSLQIREVHAYFENIKNRLNTGGS